MKGTIRVVVGAVLVITLPDTVHLGANVATGLVVLGMALMFSGVRSMFKQVEVV